MSNSDSKRTVLAFFSNPEAANLALSGLRRRGILRAVVYHYPQNGTAKRLAAGCPRYGRVSFAIFLAVIASFLVTLLGSHTPPRVFLEAAGAAFALGWAASFVIAPRIKSTGEENLLLPGELLLVARIPVAKLDQVLSLLSEGEPVPVFVLHRVFPIPPHSDNAPVPGEEPEPLTGERLQSVALELAREHQAQSAPQNRNRSIEASLERSTRVLEDVNGDLGATGTFEKNMDTSAQWLLDNSYVIRAHAAECLQNLPAHYPRILPSVIKNGHPVYRVHDLAARLVDNFGMRIDREVFKEFLESYQSVLPLKIAELWLFPVMLRVVILERLARFAERVDVRQYQRESSYFWSNRLAAASRMGAPYIGTAFAKLGQTELAREVHFVASITEQLYDEEATLGGFHQWFERHAGQTIHEVVRQDHRQQAMDQTSISSAVETLRKLSQIDYNEIFEQLSHVERILREDPAKVYSRSDFHTRDLCRQAVEEISRRSQKTELEIARAGLASATASAENSLENHIGYHLIDDGRLALEEAAAYKAPLRVKTTRAMRKYPTFTYLSISIIFTFSLLLLALAANRSWQTQSWVMTGFLFFLGLFPASEAALQIAQAIIVAILPPTSLPRLRLKDEELPDELRTLVVVPMMLLTPASIEAEAEKLEVRYLANREENLYFALLSDFTDAPQAEMPEDASLLEGAVRCIGSLNRRYPGRFILFHRKRIWSEGERRWMGRERKRGKIEDLNRLLCGQPVANQPDFVRSGILPSGIRYVITLDSDTQLPSGSARSMIGTIAHPLNQVQFDSSGMNHQRGFTIIQPRASVGLPEAMKTRFTRVFSDITGTDPYSRVISDIYQDLFGEGIYHGKAIYDVQAFHRILTDRFPENLLLSHDLIEGAYVGVGLATDIEVFENFPEDYATYSRRQHRWVRGDWQIIQWCQRNVPTPKGMEPNPLTAANRWKIFDNLRRSLVTPVSIAILLVSWILGESPRWWSVFVGLCLFLPALAHLFGQFSSPLDRRWHSGREVGRILARLLVEIALLPHQAFILCDAIARATYRRLVSHHDLLEWETAELTRLKAGAWMSKLWAQLIVISGLAVALLIAVTAAGSKRAAFPYVILWIASPLIVRWLGRQQRAHRGARLSDDDRAFLRAVSRETWRYFDDLVGPATNWLPPDNSQIALRKEVALRTSPTNMGLWFMAALTARDLGYLTPEQFVERCTSTMNTLDKLVRSDGHFLNWYDLATLEPLQPRYVSSVDSGNFLAMLWVLEQSLVELTTLPVIGSQSLRGLADTLALARSVSKPDARSSVAYRALENLFWAGSQPAGIVERLRLSNGPIQQLAEGSRWNIGGGEERTYWIHQLEAQASAWVTYANSSVRWMELFAAPPQEFLSPLGEAALQAQRQILKEPPSLRTMADGPGQPMNLFLTDELNTEGLPKELCGWLEELARAYQEAQSFARSFLQTIEELTVRVRKMASEIDMSVLYDRKRKLFAIGYQVGGPLEATNHYDLLASEARLASLVSIAKGDVPVEHWLTLGRPHEASPDGPVLMSWGGTMFEYLMPQLFMHGFSNSLLQSACQQAVKRQIAYGDERGIPWGISESAFSAIDSHQIYQYRAFGVPGLGLKPDLHNDLVVSPYSTMLALTIAPDAAIRNLHRLEESGMRGPLGFYESIDFTRQRNREGTRGVMVQTYMGHHQGMSLMALDNTLNRDIMQRRFHSDPRIRAVEALLYERIPLESTPLPEAGTEGRAPLADIEQPEVASRTTAATTLIPQVQLLGNGRYSLMITNSGGGYSSWSDFDVTSWRADTTRDHWGSFCYLRDLKNNTVWSNTFHPAGGAASEYAATFTADRAEFYQRSGGIECLTEITVSPEDDVEVRRLTITNRSLRTRQLDITSFVELALAPHAAERSHPAFSKLFIETEALFEGAALLAWRRPRDAQDSPVYSGHVVCAAQAGGEIEYETDRMQFLGRGRDTTRPDACSRPLTGTTGAVLDPIFSLRYPITLEPRERTSVAFVTVAAGTREATIKLLEKYRNISACSRAFELAWNHSQLEFRHLGIEAEMAHRFRELAAHLIYPNRQLRAPAERLKRNALGQSRLWAYGISGDLPILLVTVADERSVALVREVLLAHTYWRLRGLKADLVIMNQESASYDEPVNHQLDQLIRAHSVHSGIDIPGGVFLRKWNQIPEEDLTLLLSCARVVLTSAGGSLRRQLGRGEEARVSPPPLVPEARETGRTPLLPALDLEYFNGYGGFASGGQEYVCMVHSGRRTPLPWINVLANPYFGALVGESGLGYAWRGNSQTNRITPWRNDPVTDAPGEALYIRDEESGEYWTPSLLPAPDQSAYRAAHGQGYSRFEHNSHGIKQTLTVFVPVNDAGGDPIRIGRLKLENASETRRKLSVTAYVDWVLGSTREESQTHLVTEWDPTLKAVLARNAYHPSFNRDVAFLCLWPAATSYTADRSAFIGRNHSLAHPAAMSLASLPPVTGAGLDPCGAVQTEITLQPGEQRELLILLGQTGHRDDVKNVIARYANLKLAEKAFNDTRQWWNRKITTIQIHTPVPSLDLLFNRWLLYQSLACRVWGRTATYQSSGAFGFRDQLQDIMALVYAAPELARQHILYAASHQFTEGDVQHWWHPDSGAGIRSRCSDDLLWLPLAVQHYVRVTGDTQILDVPVEFLDGPPLKEGEQEMYFVPSPAQEKQSLFEHCRRAVERSASRGSHELPLMGNGDWNDGMNQVGVGGKGESVWLAWFLCEVLRSFAALAEIKDRPELAIKCYRQVADLRAAVEKSAWDGEWYLRAFFDDGTPLGSSANAEARIDSVAQSWAAITAVGDANRARRAMESVWTQLVREKEELILLFAPPFDHSTPHPGYIMGYPPGVRENGGQYTHAALWVAMAFARLGDGTRAVELLQMINPIERTSDAGRVREYQGEPYAVAADISSSEGRVGRAGWTWYTGSAGWNYRVIIEEVLGFRLHGNLLSIKPSIPANWPGFSIDYRYGSTMYHIVVVAASSLDTSISPAKLAQVMDGQGMESQRVEIDGTPLPNGEIRLQDDGQPHEIQIVLRSPVAVATPLSQ